MGIAVPSAGFVLDRPDLGHRAEGLDLADASFFVDALDPSAPRLLPPAAYRALAFAELEDDAIWTRSWLCIGFEAEIPALGDLLPFTAGHHGIHVQREADGGLVGRFNKAQHGGCRSVPLQCRTGTKTRCSFTACGHSRDGGPLLSGENGPTPAMHQYLGLRPERLLPVAARPSGPLVLIHLDPGAPPPEPLGNGLGELAGESRRVEYAANWKLAAQHLADGQADGDDGPDSLHVSGRLSTGEPVAIRLHYPNLVLLTAHGETCAVILQPTALGQTLLRVGLLGAGDGRSADPAVSLAAWLDEIALRMRAAEAAQAVLSGMGGTAVPEANAVGLWLQGRIAASVRGRPAVAQTQPIYAAALGRGC